MDICYEAWSPYKASQFSIASFTLISDIFLCDNPDILLTVSKKCFLIDQKKETHKNFALYNMNKQQKSRKKYYFLRTDYLCWFQGRLENPPPSSSKLSSSSKSANWRKSATDPWCRGFVDPLTFLKSLCDLIMNKNLHVKFIIHIHKSPRNPFGPVTE